MGDNSTLSSVGEAHTIPDLLPNVKTLTVLGQYASSSTAVVLGEPIEVEPDRAAIMADGDGSDDRQLEFSDTQAQYRIWTVHVRVTDVVAGEAPDTSVIGVRLPSGGGEVDTKRFTAGILGLGRSVWFLFGTPQKASAQLEAVMAGRYSPAWGGLAIATVDEAGTLAFPFVNADTRKTLHEEDYTVEDLRKLGLEPERRVAPGEGGR